MLFEGDFFLSQGSNSNINGHDYRSWDCLACSQYDEGMR